MSSPTNIPVTSPKAILQTIQTDPQVSRWFEFLITRPDFKRNLSTGPGVQFLYQRLTKNRREEKATLTLLCTLLIFIVLQPTPLLCVGLLILHPYFQIKSRKADIIAQIILPVIKTDYPPQQLTVTSLYQITETYGQRYHIPTLVDTICRLDRTARATIFAVLMTTVLILPLPLYKQLTYAVIAQILVIHFLRSDLIYKNLL